MLFVAVEGLRLETSAPPSLFASLFATMNVLPFIVALILAIGLSGTLFCILTARRIAHRLRNIAVAAHTWSQGEFQVAIADASADELGLLPAFLSSVLAHSPISSKIFRSQNSQTWCARRHAARP